MTSKTHQVFGLALAGTLYLATNPNLTNETLLLTALAVSIGALTPDLDKPGSLLWRKIPGGTIVDNFIAPFFGGHRIISHSLIGMLLFSAISIWLLNLLPIDLSINIVTVWIGYLIGYFSHLLSDSFTAKGCPWLYPLPNYFGFPPHPLEGGRIITGKWFENLILFPLVSIWFMYIALTVFQRL